MDNASKNASDMIGSLQMKYNRGRQAVITNELIDIITGTWLRFTGQELCLIMCHLQVPVLCRPLLELKSSAYIRVLP